MFFTILTIIAVAIFFLNYTKKNISISNTEFPENDLKNEPDVKSEKKPIEPDSVTKKYQSSINKQYGIIGKPLGHSLSKSYFNEMFKNNAIKAEYLAFELEDIEQFVNLVKEYPKLSGVNVTIPFKETIIPYLDRIDDAARSIGAVNVVKIVRSDEKTELHGYNTDALGFMDSISPFIKPEMHKALILGTGGASKAVYYSLKSKGVECKFVSRSTSLENLAYYELSPSIMEEFLIIVNCTPVGMFPNIDECPPIPYAYVSSEHILYDLIYNPEKTLFLKKGQERGAIIKNGYEMWKRQADASWKIWSE